jgi:hypothetical protein
MLCYTASQIICVNKYSENDLLFLLPLSVILGALFRQYEEYNVEKEDY